MFLIDYNVGMEDSEGYEFFQGTLFDFKLNKQKGTMLCSITVGLLINFFQNKRLGKM